MKRVSKRVASLLLAGSLALLSASCSKDNTSSANSTNEYGHINLSALRTQVNSLPNEPLSPAETNGLLLMREEEKLARDVYTTLYQKWGSQVFSNIAGSEQTHTDAVLMLLTKYNIADPVADNPVGVFSNPVLQNLYHQLVAEGNISVLHAYKVGATIEDLDIFDLANAMTVADNQDIDLVYSMLSKGSRNHLRSFYRNILNAGGSYTPQYLTQAKFDAIINSPMETGF